MFYSMRENQPRYLFWNKNITWKKLQLFIVKYKNVVQLAPTTSPTFTDKH